MQRSCAMRTGRTRIRVCMCVARGRYNSVLSISAPRNLRQQNLPAVRRNAGGRCLVEWPTRQRPSLCYSLTLSLFPFLSDPPTSSLSLSLHPAQAPVSIMKLHRIKQTRDRPRHELGRHVVVPFSLALSCRTRAYRHRCWLLFRLYRPMLDTHVRSTNTARHLAGMRRTFTPCRVPV